MIRSRKDLGLPDGALKLEVRWRAPGFTNPRKFTAKTPADLIAAATLAGDLRRAVAESGWTADTRGWPQPAGRPTSRPKKAAPAAAIASPPVVPAASSPTTIPDPRREAATAALRTATNPPIAPSAADAGPPRQAPAPSQPTPAVAPAGAAVTQLAEALNVGRFSVGANYNPVAESRPRRSGRRGWTTRCCKR